MSDLQAFYADTYPRLVGQVALVTGNRAEAEELVQDAVVRLVPRWDRRPGRADRGGVGAVRVSGGDPSRLSPIQALDLALEDAPIAAAVEAVDPRACLATPPPANQFWPLHYHHSAGDGADAPYIVMVCESSTTEGHVRVEVSVNINTRHVSEAARVRCDEMTPCAVQSF